MWLELKYGGKLRGRLLNVIFLEVFLFEKIRMCINCEILIVNCIVVFYNVWNVSKFVCVFLVIGWKDFLKFDDERGKNVFFLVCIVKERNGVKYKVCGVWGCKIWVFFFL